MSAPEGVKLKFADGAVVDCRTERAPELDRKFRNGTVAYWRAIPVRPVDPALTYEVHCDRLPPRTGFKMDVAAKAMRPLDGQEAAYEAVAACPQCGGEFTATWQGSTEGEVSCPRCGAVFAATFPGWTFHPKQ